ncbi:ssl1498 family light-harvesting-like protein [Nodularia spumigena CS-591/12]|uniref:photosystem II assembly protein Psb34 n=1 Tax=Nodularia spumigena TaxID=70799 RepID=UPI00232B9867|nr:ssl1498 family light-harvesting-like protein [Nodularia spumigena]MDB9304586.1 ssl1498 family light-harvesting-like protein [Nodularia spumigena CS-591/12]MDB9323367.1 ssl1498 family light-harvesting-like protein [Nodularia spumigena CS-591/07A]MDB9331800.1 ssl1498 family light-harvesting-like protein [Nodularia spumigena CS-591/04]MDB9344542.1 ssl1498 family light-harvesting-like protein [Nodularia spumigena CS-588/06]MDB9347353.1 ssl1498 family light-harvesting-like protein [Nodularia spu
MYTTINESGILNNYANEPKMYCANYPNKEEQRQYAVQGAFAILVVTTLILVTLSVS